MSNYTVRQQIWHLIANHFLMVLTAFGSFIHRTTLKAETCARIFMDWSSCGWKMWNHPLPHHAFPSPGLLFSTVSTSHSNPQPFLKVFPEAPVSSPSYSLMAFLPAPHQMDLSFLQVLKTSTLSGVKIITWSLEGTWDASLFIYGTGNPVIVNFRDCLSVTQLVCRRDKTRI